MIYTFPYGNMSSAGDYWSTCHVWASSLVSLSMGATFSPGRRWLTAAVLSHLVISFVHGAAHAGAHVPLSPAANLFVFIVILAGPIGRAGADMAGGGESGIG